jgi:flagellar basal body-associated protein FliL
MPVLKEAAHAEPQSAALQPVAPSSNQHTPAKAPAKRKKRGKAASVASALILGVILLCVGIGVVMWLFEPSATALSTGDQSSTQAASTTPDLCANVRSSDLVETEYDRFEDTTAVSLNLDDQVYVNLNDYDDTEIVLGALFVYDGRTVVEPEHSIALIFHSVSEEWQFLEYRDLIIMADGNRMRLGEMDLSDTVIGDGGDYVIEALYKDMSRETFMDIAFANNVEVQLGIKEFRINPQVLRGYRDIACRMVP